LNVSANVKIAMQCFENFAPPPPGCAPGGILYMILYRIFAKYE